MKEYKMSFEEKLSYIIDGLSYFEEEYKVNFEKDNLGLNVNFLVNEEKLKVRNEMYNYIVELFEYNKLPKVLDDEDYYKLKPYNISFKTELKESDLYTASKDFFHNYNLLYSRKYYKGIYKFANGIYSTPVKEDAIKYANAVKKESLYFEQDITLHNEEFAKIDYTLPFRIPEAKIIQDTELHYIITCIFYDGKVYNKDSQKEKQLLKFVNNLYDDEMKFKLAFLFENDISKLAIVLGYDAVYITKDYEFYFQVLNREKINVSTETFQKAEYEFIFRDTNFNL